MSPYWEKGFFEVIGIFLSRLLNLSLFKGPVYPDEIQIITLVFLSASTALIGSFLVLQKKTMEANALSHTALLGIVLVYIYQIIFRGEMENFSVFSFGNLVIVSMISAFITSLLVWFLSARAKIQEDASIGIVFTLLFALGILLVTLFTKNLHIGLEAIMGNVDALHFNDMKQSVAVFVLNLALYILLYERYLFTTFDPLLSHHLGIFSPLIHFFLIIQTSLTIMMGFRVVGVILILTFLVVPFFITRMFVHRLKPLVIISILIAALTSICSVAFSRQILTSNSISISTSGLNVLFLLLFFVFFATIAYIRRKLDLKRMAK